MTQLLQFLRKLRMSGLYDLALYWGEKILLCLPMDPEVLEEMCIIYWYTNDRRKSYLCADKILDLRPRNSALLDRTLFNKKIHEDQYEREEWCPPKGPSKGLEEEVSREPIRLITFTITTCKRLDLFIRTMDSFLRNCVDPWLIYEFICIDDNSTDEDRETMKTKYPFFRFIFKPPEDKGHWSSMDTLTKEVKTSYMLHMEDDWLFVNKVRISDLFEVMEAEDTVKQVAINKNYMELSSQEVIGGIERWTKDNLRYYIHEHIPQEVFNQKYGPRPNCNYWPHFTLRPSLIDTSVFKYLSFRNVLHFEHDFANQYMVYGWKTAFLQGFTCKHIGRLTKDIWKDDGVPNAYQLNGVPQFTASAKASAKATDHNTKTYVLNPPDAEMDLFDKQRDMVPFQVETFNGGHVKLWAALVKSDNDAFYVLEHDVIISKAFQEEIKDSIGDHDLVTYGEGLSAYFITRHGAFELIKYFYDRIPCEPDVNDIVSSGRIKVKQMEPTVFVFCP